MSKETIEWLNAYTMIGFTSHREKYANNGFTMIDPSTGQVKAWWATEGFKNAYPDAIPPEAVEATLFNWEPHETEVWNRLYLPDDSLMYDGETGDGRKFAWVKDSATKGIIHPITKHIFTYVGTESYRLHHYKPWLMDNIARLLDTSSTDLGIATAGLLRMGGVAYVTVEMPEMVKGEAGMDIRPSLLATTSIDATKATSYNKVTLIPVCDNSLNASMKGASHSLKIKHTVKSLPRLAGAREALGIIYQQAEEMTKFLDTLVNIDVTDAVFQDIVNHLVTVPEPKLEAGTGKVLNQRVINLADNRQGELLDLWNRDQRAAPWHGTLLGAMQSVNTWNEHYRSHNDNGVERVMTGTLNGQFMKDDAKFWEIVGCLSEEGKVDMRPVAAVLLDA